MAVNDVEAIQSLVRRYYNKLVKDHFQDIAGEDDSSLSLGAPRAAIKRLCLHKDNDPLVLTILRLLIYWVEARGLFNEIIYGIPSTDFEIKYNYYPQVKFHFLESRYESSNNNRRPIRAEVSIRWRNEDYSTAKITQLANKVYADFATPKLKFKKGRECYTYYDDQKGYRFTIYGDSEADAKKVIGAAIGIQDEETPDWENNFRSHKSNVNYAVQETVRIMGETKKKPKKRPIGNVEFTYAELFIPGNTRPIILVDVTGYKPSALKYG